MFNCERFYTYLYGKHFVVESDHKPLDMIHMKNCASKVAAYVAPNPAIWPDNPIPPRKGYAHSECTLKVTYWLWHTGTLRFNSLQSSWVLSLQDSRTTEITINSITVILVIERRAHVGGRHSHERRSCRHSEDYESTNSLAAARISQKHWEDPDEGPGMCLLEWYKLRNSFANVAFVSTPKYNRDQNRCNSMNCRHGPGKFWELTIST